MIDERFHNAASRKALIARLLDEPGVTWASWGTAIRVAAEQAASDAGPDRSAALVRAAGDTVRRARS